MQALNPDNFGDWLELWISRWISNYTSNRLLFWETTRQLQESWNWRRNMWLQKCKMVGVVYRYVILLVTIPVVSADPCQLFWALSTVPAWLWSVAGFTIHPELQWSVWLNMTRKMCKRQELPWSSHGKEQLWCQVTCNHNCSQSYQGPSPRDCKVRSALAISGPLFQIAPTPSIYERNEIPGLRGIFPSRFWTRKNSYILHVSWVELIAVFALYRHVDAASFLPLQLHLWWL